MRLVFAIQSICCPVAPSTAQHCFSYKQMDFFSRGTDFHGKTSFREAIYFEVIRIIYGGVNCCGVKAFGKRKYQAKFKVAETFTLKDYKLNFQCKHKLRPVTSNGTAIKDNNLKNKPNMKGRHFWRHFFPFKLCQIRFCLFVSFVFFSSFEKLKSLHKFEFNFPK